MADAGLEARIKRLDDLEEIKRLMSLYCYHADNRDGANWSEVFAEDEVFETDLYGKYEGRVPSGHSSIAPSQSTTITTRSSISKAIAPSVSGFY